ncbi:hypothetical protein [Streptomyces sp. Root1310]|uniref:hypothetical protein n=1 Tax=Streptomyces sp. Root1310 TaxID=1736452 RepID=UPI00070EA563|nr:hypothetical protein [Streptomyces sp. Root1310]KQX71462.1 hypothetical protein ASD48_13905 [Streptomyces sp. Root1310]
MTAEVRPGAALRVRNSGSELLELILEPYGSDHWMRPGETFVIWTLGRPGDGESGAAGTSEAFEVEHTPGTVTVYAEVLPAYVGDVDGNEIDCGHNRPGPVGPFRIELP